jgi:hypothetical protein
MLTGKMLHISRPHREASLWIDVDRVPGTQGGVAHLRDRTEIGAMLEAGDGIIPL